MLQITEQTPTRMVLEDKRHTASIIAGFFTIVSAGSVLLLGYQAVQSLILGAPKDLMGWRYFGTAFFLLILIGVMALGALATLHFLRGTTWTLDKDAEVITWTGTNFIRPVENRYPIYGVSRLDVETSPEMRAYGLFLVLRTGERIPIAAFAMMDSEHMERVVGEVRTFLRSVGG